MRLPRKLKKKAKKLKEETEIKATIEALYYDHWLNWLKECDRKNSEKA